MQTKTLFALSLAVFAFAPSLRAQAGETSFWDAYALNQAIGAREKLKIEAQYPTLGRLISADGTHLQTAREALTDYDRAYPGVARSAEAEARTFGYSNSSAHHVVTTNFVARRGR